MNLSLSLAARSIIAACNTHGELAITLCLMSGEDAIAVPQTATGEGLYVTFKDGQRLFCHWDAIESFNIRGGV